MRRLLVSAMLGLGVLSAVAVGNPVGEFTVEEDARTGQKVVRYKGKVVYRADTDYMFVDVDRVFNVKGNRVALVSLSTGGRACPAMYVFITVRPDGNAQASREFGTCSDLPQITQEGDRIIVRLPDAGKRRAVFIYQDGQVFEKKR